MDLDSLRQKARLFGYGSALFVAYCLGGLTWYLLGKIH